MAPKKNTKKKAPVVEESSEVGSIFQQFGRGILTFFEMLFGFILSLFKVLPEFLKAIAWLVVASVMASFLVVLVMYFAFSVFGIKDSEQFQAYRDVVVGKMIDEYDLVEVLKDDDEEVVEEVEVNPDFNIFN
jgi:hypothetical protein